MLLILVFAFYSLLFYSNFALDCKAPEGADLNLMPQFWCSLIANVSIKNECSTYVEEQILLPWSSGFFRRNIPHQNNQKVFGITATEDIQGEKTELHVERLQQESDSTTKLKIRPGQSKQPKVVILQYRIERGVTTDATCDVIAFPEEDPPDGSSTMVVKWAIGGTSIENIQHLQTHFSLIKDSRNQYLDSLVRHPDGIQFKTITVRDDPKATVRVSHIGDTADLHPAEFIFYFRFALAYGWAECPNPRDCSQEVLLLKEVETKGISLKLVIGLSVGGGVVLLIIGFSVWIYCTRSRNGQISPMGNGGLNATESSGRLPDSLRHFAYDTGDEQSSKKWKEWTEASPRRGEEIRAIELSPRNRVQQFE